MVYNEMTDNAIEQAVQTVCGRINYEVTTLAKFQDSVCTAIRCMSEMPGYKPELVASIAADSARVLVRVSLYYATKRELDNLADPEKDAVYMHVAPDDGGESIAINRAQYDSLLRKFRQNPDGSPNFTAFMARARKGWDCLMLQWCGMWLGIEKDGYTHS